MWGCRASYNYTSKPYGLNLIRRQLAVIICNRAHLCPTVKVIVSQSCYSLSDIEAEIWQ